MSLSSLAQGWQDVHRYGIVNIGIFTPLLFRLAPPRVVDVVTTVSLAVFAGWRLLRPGPNAQRRSWRAWAALAVVMARTGSVLPAFSEAVDAVLPARLFHLPWVDLPAHQCRDLFFRYTWNALSFYTVALAPFTLESMAPIAIPVALVGLVILPLSLAAFSLSTCAVLLYELFRATKQYLFTTTSSTQAALAFRALARAQMASDSEYRTLDQQLGAAAAVVDVLDLQPALRNLEKPWLQLSTLSDEQLLRLCRSLDSLSSGAFGYAPSEDPRFELVDAKMLLPTFRWVKQALDVAYTTCPSFSQDASFLGVTYQLAGAILCYLPFPPLQHLARPPRRHLLGHLLFTPFLMRYLLNPANRFLSRGDERVLPPSSGPFADFLDALPPFLLAAQAMSLTSEKTADVLGAYLTASQARARAVKAENAAHQAILDETLRWKNRTEGRRGVV
ncbi:hypothetical protein JCM10213_005591 [Rhodosporidiobolus nylandii]